MRGKSRWLHRYPRRGVPHLLPGERGRGQYTPRTNSCSLRVIRKRVNYRCASRYTVYCGIPPCFLLRRIPRGREDAARARCASHAVTAQYACASTSVRGNYVLTVQHYRRQGTHPGAAATAARHVNLQVAGGHRRDTLGCCAYANTCTRRTNVASVEQPATRLAVPESPDQPRGRPRFGTGIGHFSNRKSGVSRYLLRTRVRMS